MIHAAPSAWADPPADPNSIVTLQVENDAVAGTDKYYTSGLSLGYTAPTGDVPDSIARLGHDVWGYGQQRLSFDLQQNLFTPSNTQIKPPNPRDRPYAGVLFGNLSLIQDTDYSRSTLALGLGVVGPGAGGEEIQNGFHSLIGDRHNQGWSYQVHNEPVVQVSAGRIWRVDLARLATPVGGLEFDALPQISASVGTWRDYAQAGGEIRVGQGLHSDFGAPRMLPGLTGGNAYVAVRPFAWYLYVGGDGQAVGFDSTLDGNLFRRSAHVTSEPIVGEFQAGLAVLAFGARLSAFHVIQTKEFNHQSGSTFSFDGVALSTKF